MNKKIYVLILLCVLTISGATHVVTNINDSGQGSLRQAIIDANNDITTPRIITFEIGSGAQTIKVKKPLPALTHQQIIIDGTSQPGWSAGNPMIVLDGSLTPTFTQDAITISGTHDCIIDSLVINNGFKKGIAILNGADNNAIYNCFIGLDQTGTSTMPNAIGIAIHNDTSNHANNNIVGAPNKGNVISGNKYVGLFLSGNVDNTIIQSNKMGTDKDGMIALDNLKAALAIASLPINYDVSCANTIIGGTQTGEGNIISGNNGAAILMGAQPIDNVTIQGNIIGADATGLNPLYNLANIVALQIGGLTVTGLTIGGPNPGEDNIIMP